MLSLKDWFRFPKPGYQTNPPPPPNPMSGIGPDGSGLEPRRLQPSSLPVPGTHYFWRTGLPGMDMTSIDVRPKRLGA